jgi:hypothetical protein
VLARTNARKINISVTLDPDLLGAIERLARRERVTVSAMLRGILRAEMTRRGIIRSRRKARTPKRGCDSMPKAKELGHEEKLESERPKGSFVRR